VAFHVVIPARYASTRLPGKPLLDIVGSTMIQRVVERACASSADQVLVATDDARIAAAVHDPRRPGEGIAVMTDAALSSGTDRVAAVAAERGWSDDTVVVNVQGDEPFLPPSLIEQAADLLGRDPNAGIATLAAPIASLEEFLDPNVVKVVTAHDAAALYFSRAPIPWRRDGGVAGAPALPEPPALRHVGLYAYRAAFLRAFPTLPAAPIERTEALEQLRALWHGHRIAVLVSEVAPGLGVDTPEDLARVRALFAAGPA
jgi:3-deoxy-manno-octulosonate cytidylyltransferase (CMP-KDO synthetase)